MIRLALMIAIYLGCIYASAQDLFNCKIDCSITLPLRNEDVNYNANVWTEIGKEDINYLIEYSATTDTIKNFSSYFDGNYYRFEGEKLREYHRQNDSVPFMNKGKQRGVQESGIFMQFMPWMIDSMRQELNNVVKIFKDTTVHGEKVDAVKIQEMMKGEVVRDILIAYDINTKKPVFYESVNSPGSISEQTVYAIYYYPSSMGSIEQLSEKFLISRYPEAFMKYRISNFALENLPGRRLPDFYLPSTTGERYTWCGAFNNKAILVFLDPGNGFNNEIISSVRSAVSSMDTPVDVLWIFRTKNVDSAIEEMPSTRESEYALISGGRLAGECGITGCPVILYVNKSGIVEGIKIGYDKNMRETVFRGLSSFKN